MCITGQRLQRQKEIWLFHIPRQMQALTHILKIKNNWSLSRGLESTICHTWFILNSPGNWGGTLCLLIVFVQRKNKLISLWQEVALHCAGRHCQSQTPISHNNWCSIFPDGYISRGWLPGPWERYSWVVRLVRHLFSCLKKLTYISKLPRKTSILQVF